MFDGEDGAKAKCGICGGLTLLTLILCAILIPNSLEKVGPTEVGLTYNVVFPHLSKEAKMEGLHSKPPFGTIIKWPKDQKIVEFKGKPMIKTKHNDECEDNDEDNDSDACTMKVMTGRVDCNSYDGIKIEMDIAFQFIPDTQKIYELTLLYENFNKYQELIKIQARSSIRHGCGKYTAQQFQEMRPMVAKTMLADVKQDCSEKFMAIVSDLQIKNIERPRVYQAAVDERESARADIDLAENERQQRITKASTSLANAKIEAKAVLDSAYTAGNVTMAYATAAANAHKKRYSTYAKVYASAKKDLGLTHPGTLSYFASEMVRDKGGANQVMNMAAPAQTSYKAEL